MQPESLTRQGVRVGHSEVGGRCSAYGPVDPKPIRRPSGSSPRVPDDPDQSERASVAAEALPAFAPALPAAAHAPGARLAAGTATSPVAVVLPSRTPVINERLVARKMAVSVHAAIRESGCRRVLITSPSKSSGTSHFVRVVAPELHAIAYNEYRFLRPADLEQFAPPREEDPQITLVDGPSMFDGDGLLSVPQDWMAAFDGAILVVMGRRTETEALKESVKWMADSRIKTIGIIWNDYVNPPPELRFRLWKRYMREGTMMRDLLTMIRTGGRSLRKLA